MIKKIKKLFNPLTLLIFLIILVYWQFFFLGKIPIPADLLSGAYYPWLDYKWGFPTGIPVKNPIISDVFSNFYPWKYLIIDIFKKGAIPLWNQYAYSGSPLLASYHTGVFFPFNLILFLPKNIGWGLYISAQTFLAAIGMYLLLSIYVKNNAAKIAGAIIFSLSGLMATWVEFGTGTYAAAALPWIFYFLNQYLAKSKSHYLSFLTISFICLYLAGHTQLTLYSSLLFGTYILYLFFIKKNITLQKLFTISIFIFLSIGISLIELLPAFSQVNLSVRGSEAYSKTFNFGLTPWYDMIRIYVADFFGNPTTYNYWSKISYHENASFLGALTLPLLLPLLFNRFRKTHTSFWLWVFAISIFLAVDHPLTRLLYSQPLPFLTYSSASRILFITSFSAGILASIGLEKLIISKSYRRFFIYFALIFIFIIIFALTYLKLINIDNSLLKISLRNSIIPLGLLSVSIFLLKIKIKNIFLSILFVFLIFFDLARYFQKYNPFITAKLIFPKTPTIEFLQKQPGLFRIGRLNREVLTPNTWIPYKLSSIEGYDPLGLENYARFFNRVNNNKYSDTINRYTEIFNPDFKFLDALNVKYLLSVENDKNKISPYVKANKLEPVFRDKSTVVYKNPKALDRAYFISQTIITDNKQKMAEILDNSNFDPRTSAVIFSSDSLPSIWSLGKVNIDNYSDNNLTLKTENTKDGFLVLADTYDPGWQASIGGQPTKIYEVNGALRGVVVPKGNHQIKMVYWPTSVDWGIKISLLGLFGLFAISLYNYFIHDRQNP